MGILQSLPELGHLSPIQLSEFLILEPVDSEVIILRDMGLGRTIPLAFLDLWLPDSGQWGFQILYQ